MTKRVEKIVLDLGLPWGPAIKAAVGETKLLEASVAQLSSKLKGSVDVSEEVKGSIQAIKAEQAAIVALGRQYGVSAGTIRKAIRETEKSHDALGASLDKATGGFFGGAQEQVEGLYELVGAFDEMESSGGGATEVITALFGQMGLAAAEAEAMAAGLVAAGAAAAPVLAVLAPVALGIAGIAAAAMAGKATWDEYQERVVSVQRELGVLSETSGLTIQTLEALRVAAGAAGSEDLDEINDAATALGERMADAARGSDEATAALARFGITQEMIASGDVDAAFLQLVDSLDQVGAGADRNKDLLTAIGESGAKALIEVESLSGGLAGYLEITEKYGVATVNAADNTQRWAAAQALLGVAVDDAFGAVGMQMDQLLEASGIFEALEDAIPPALGAIVGFGRASAGVFVVLNEYLKLTGEQLHALFTGDFERFVDQGLDGLQRLSSGMAAAVKLGMREGQEATEDFREVLEGLGSDVPPVEIDLPTSDDDLEDLGKLSDALDELAQRLERVGLEPEALGFLDARKQVDGLRESLATVGGLTADTQAQLQDLQRGLFAEQADGLIASLLPPGELDRFDAETQRLEALSADLVNTVGQDAAAELGLLDAIAARKIELEQERADAVQAIRDQELAQERQTQAMLLAAHSDTMQTRAALVQLEHDQQLDALRSALRDQLLSYEQYEQARLMLATDTSRVLAQVQVDTYAATASGIAGGLALSEKAMADLADASIGHSREMRAVSEGLALAQVAFSAGEAYAKAFNNTLAFPPVAALGPYALPVAAGVGAGAAALVAAGGIAQVAGAQSFAAGTQGFVPGTGNGSLAVLHPEEVVFSKATADREGRDRLADIARGEDGGRMLIQQVYRGQVFHEMVRDARDNPGPYRDDISGSSVPGAHRRF